jgi:mannose-6-phosphate isomerase-like protein (cupin superfamily)
MLPPGEGCPLGDGLSPARFKAGNAETGDTFNVHYTEAAQGGPGTPLHIHHGDDEGVLLLEGEAIALCVSRPFHLTPGRYAFLPRGVPHAFCSLTASRRVVIMAPSTNWEYIGLHMAAERRRGRS